MHELLDVVKVEPKPGYLLELEFENGERQFFNMSSIIDKKLFIRLKETNAFFAAHVDYGTVVWPGNIEIDPPKRFTTDPFLSKTKPHKIINKNRVRFQFSSSGLQSPRGVLWHSQDTTQSRGCAHH